MDIMEANTSNQIDAATLKILNTTAVIKMQRKQLLP